MNLNYEGYLYWHEKNGGMPYKAKIDKADLSVHDQLATCLTLEFSGVDDEGERFDGDCNLKLAEMETFTMSGVGVWRWSGGKRGVLNSEVLIQDVNEKTNWKEKGQFFEGIWTEFVDGQSCEYAFQIDFDLINP